MDTSASLSLRSFLMLWCSSILLIETASGGAVYAVTQLPPTATVMQNDPAPLGWTFEEIEARLEELYKERIWLEKQLDRLYEEIAKAKKPSQRRALQAESLPLRSQLEVVQKEIRFMVRHAVAARKIKREHK